MRSFTIALALACLSGCHSRNEIVLHYNLGTIDPAEVVRVETLIGVAASDPRAFFADQPYRSVSLGVGYEVRDLDGSGKRSVIITHDATLGYAFKKDFQFTLLPPAGETAPPLEIVARAFAASDRIGETEPIAARFAANASAKVELVDQRCAGKSCVGDSACCDDTCTQLDSNVQSCGACGVACGASESCIGSTCRCAGGSGCEAGETCCTNGCQDLQNDPFNCGACGKACNAGESCVAGQCSCKDEPGGAACAGVSCCAGTGCSTDPSGGCACGSGPLCTGAQVCCTTGAGQTCANVASDAANCGACGKQCPTGTTCAGGSCTCNGVDCSASDTCCSTGCADLQTDVFNCGKCGNACAAGELCRAGQCVCGTSGACSSGQACCTAQATGRTSCTDLDSDTNNCGSCGNGCNLRETCANGRCSCGGGAACVGNQRCCGDGCYDVSSDPKHCGACDKACSDGQACSGGQCVTTTCAPACSNGNTCVGTTCQCNGGAACKDGFTCCEKVGCVDLLTDHENCGKCGNALASNVLCCNGSPTLQTTSNCGKCGNVCSSGATLVQCCSCPPAQPLGYCTLGSVCLCSAPSEPTN